MGVLLLNSRGLNTRKGTEIIYKKLCELGYEDLTLCSKKSPTSKVGDELRPHHT